MTDSTTKKKNLNNKFRVSVRYIIYINEQFNLFLKNKLINKKKNLTKKKEQLIELNNNKKIHEFLNN